MDIIDMSELENDPQFAPLRGDPRVRRVVASQQ